MFLSLGKLTWTLKLSSVYIADRGMASETNILLHRIDALVISL